VIDAHVHVWTLEPDRYPWQQTLAHVPIPGEPATAEDLLDEMDRAGVGHAVLVQPSVYGWNNDYLCDCLDRWPDRFVGICLVDPRADGAGEALRYWCAERGCRGVRVNLIGHSDAAWVLDAARQELWDAARELGISVSFQMLPGQAPVVRELARREPETLFIVDYLGPDAFHDGSGAPAVELLAEAPNAWFKLIASGPDSRERYPFRDLWPLYEHAVRSFGPERIVFGTDFPHVRRACPYADAAAWLAELPFLDERARAAIGNDNAAELWDLAYDRRRA
jgi:predicted TIM-barrel fold metal-dependent hydrolase